MSNELRSICLSGSGISINLNYVVDPPSSKSWLYALDLELIFRTHF